MAFQIWLGNPYQAWYDWHGLCRAVEELFKPVIARVDAGRAKGSKLGGVRCNSTIVKPAIGPSDLVVYVVPAEGYGFAGVSFGSGGRADGPWGLCVIDAKQFCAEVYIADEVTNPDDELRVDRLTSDPPTIGVTNKRSIRMLSKAVYHEAMHGLTGDRPPLHGRHGVGIGAEQLTRRTVQTETDIRVMAGHLQSKKHRPWTGGWAALDARWGPATRNPTLQNPKK